MKKQAKCAAALIAAASLCLIAAAKIPAAFQAPAPTVSHSTTGYGPKILLLHDSSQSDLAWTEAARQLASHFEVTLLDITEFINDSQGVQRLRQAIRALEIDDARIAGSAHAENLALQYALSFPEKSSSFILPHTGEDLQLLADFINSTKRSRS